MYATEQARRTIEEEIGTTDARIKNTRTNGERGKRKSERDRAVLPIKVNLLTFELRYRATAPTHSHTRACKMLFGGVFVRRRPSRNLVIFRCILCVCVRAVNCVIVRAIRHC